MGGLWEFPGGKRLEGETFEACLKRELLEELAIEVEVGSLFEEVVHTYPDRKIHLKFYLCKWLMGEPRAIGCAAFAWVRRDGLPRYAFPPADERILGRLKAEDRLWTEER
jgi:mutator protein MutT